MPEINVSLNNIAIQLKAAAVEGKALSDNARFAISQYLSRLEKHRFFVECSAAGKSPAEAEQAWQLSLKNDKATETAKLDSSIAKGLAAGVFAALRK